MLKRLRFPHGELLTPAFLPDATRAVVRSVDSRDLDECGIPALMMNAFHLMRTPGSSTIKSLGGLHAMYAWSKPLGTDSGGFQAYSMIRENPRYGRIGDDGIIFRPDGSERKFNLTPEKVVQLQLAYGSDLVVCLDECTHPDDSDETQRRSVERTVRWAERCRRQFDLSLAQMKIEEPKRPLIMGVIQGGRSKELRRQCADALLNIGFDCFGYGGWPLDAERKLLRDMTAYTRELVPADYPMHALGVGHPLSIIDCVSDGYDLFDSALPTRDARRGRLYGPWPLSPEILGQAWFEFVYIQDERYIKERRPIASGCDCLCCSRFAAGYLHHLFKIEDALFLRLATIHNLRFMARLMEILRTR